MAETAAQVTAGRTKRENGASGVKVVEGLFFDGVNAEAGGTAVTTQHNPIFPCLTHETEAALAGSQFTVSGAEVALETAVIQPMMPLGLNDARSDYCAVKFSHYSEQKSMVNSALWIYLLTYLGLIVTLVILPLLSLVI